ncbi:Leucine-Rich Repeat Serine/Threonine-Protein Kinase 2 [Manis pentadactyla]|nr:Leucine-Rich Repeat Serine/Threonine-Protein Kinase 2 [Manis pentadactyla]
MGSDFPRSTSSSARRPSPAPVTQLSWICGRSQDGNLVKIMWELPNTIYLKKRKGEKNKEKETKEKNLLLVLKVDGGMGTVDNSTLAGCVTGMLDAK